MIRWAVVAPTLPAPMTVTLRRGTWCMEAPPGCGRVALGSVVGIVGSDASRGRALPWSRARDAYPTRGPALADRVARRRRRTGRSWPRTSGPARRPGGRRHRGSAQVPRGSRTSAGTSGHGERAPATRKTGSRRVGTSSRSAVQGRPDHLAGVVDVHPVAGAVGAAGPAGVHQPDRARPSARGARRASRRTRRGGAAGTAPRSRPRRSPSAPTTPTSVPASFAV